MKNFSPGKPPRIRKAHYLTSVAAFVLAFGVLGVILEFSSYATSTTGTVIGIAGKCLDNYNNLQKSANKIDIWTCQNDEAQVWTVNGTTSSPGTIVNENGYCLGIAQGNTTNGTNVILFPCDGNNSQEWFYNAQTGQIINKSSQTCLDDSHSGTANGNQIDIYTCNGTAAQKWQYVVATPPPTPTPTPTPAPTPSPAPTPAPKKPTPSSSRPPISVSTTYTPPTSASGLNQTTSDSSATTTQLGQAETSTLPTSSKRPAITNLTISNITATSVRLAWHSNTEAGYSIRYGESSGSFPNVDHFKASNTTVTVTLNKLPSGKHIYMSITPTSGNTTGDIKYVDFKTAQKTNLWIPILIGLLFLLGVIGMLIKLIGRKPVIPDHSNDELPLPEAPPVIPQEDQATYNNRVNWWMPQKFRQTGIPKNSSTDQYPDMFDEGRKRLEEEEKEHKLPKP